MGWVLFTQGLVTRSTWCCFSYHIPAKNQRVWLFPFCCSLVNHPEYECLQNRREICCFTTAVSTTVSLWRHCFSYSHLNYASWYYIFGKIQPTFYLFHRQVESPYLSLTKRPISGKPLNKSTWSSKIYPAIFTALSKTCWDFPLIITWHGIFRALFRATMIWYTENMRVSLQVSIYRIKNTKRTPIGWACTLDVLHVRYYYFDCLPILSYC